MTDNFMGKVIFANKQGYAIIEDGYGRLYIGPSKGYYRGEEAMFEKSKVKRTPSLLIAMLELGEISRQEIKDFIEKGEE